MKYQSGSTKVHGHASDAWAARAGVCQDMAHLAIGGAALGAVPARYVSGYLHPRREPEVGETVTGESHAWIEWWDGELDRLRPDQRHRPAVTGTSSSPAAATTPTYRR